MRLAASPALLLSLALAACSSSSGGGSSSTSSSSGGGSSSTPCNQDPWQCSSAQTCWFESATAFACMNAGPGTLGSTCLATPGTPTCGAGLVCFQNPGAAAGTCVAYCSTTDMKHACTGAAVCETAAFVMGGPEFNVCAPMATGGGDGGTGGDSGTAAEGGGTADGGSDAPAGG